MLSYRTFTLNAFSCSRHTAVHSRQTVAGNIQNSRLLKPLWCAWQPSDKSCLVGVHARRVEAWCSRHVLDWTFLYLYSSGNKVTPDTMISMCLRLRQIRAASCLRLANRNAAGVFSKPSAHVETHDFDCQSCLPEPRCFLQSTTIISTSLTTDGTLVKALQY